MLRMRLRLIGGILAVVLTSAALSGEAQAMRTIPDDNLAYPVLIKSGTGGSGSGFFLNTPTAVYLVTAKHVLFDPASKKLRDTNLELLSYPKDPSDKSRNLITMDLAELDKAGNVKPHSSEDVVVVRMATVGDTPDASAPTARAILPLPGVAFKEHANTGILGVALDGVKTFEKVLTANEIVVFGYPTSIGLQQLPQLDPLRPLLRKGIVAGQNPSKRSLVLDCPSYPGNSGGPVLEIDQEGLGRHFYVIGVVRGFVPFAETWVNVQHGYSNTTILNSGYSIATPMDFVLELIK